MTEPKAERCGICNGLMEHCYGGWICKTCEPPLRQDAPADPYPHEYQWLLGSGPARWLVFTHEGQRTRGFDESGKLLELPYPLRTETECMRNPLAWKRTFPPVPEAQKADAEEKGTLAVPEHAAYWREKCTAAERQSNYWEGQFREKCMVSEKRIKELEARRIDEAEAASK